VKVFGWDLKFADCLTHNILEIKCPTNINDFTIAASVLFKLFINGNEKCH